MESVTTETKIILAILVDDIAVAANSCTELDVFKAELVTNFRMTEYNIYLQTKQSENQIELQYVVRITAS
jgi:hypothetical protein